MKKIAFIILLVSGTVVSGYSQASFALGLKGGLNFASLDGENAQEVYNNRTGYHIGAFANIRVQNFGIQPEVSFSSQGATLEAATETIYKFNYVNVPVLLKFYPVKFINIQAGPQFGFLTSSEIVINDASQTLEDFKDSDLSFALGVGVELPFGLNLEGRYNMGIKDINDDPTQVEKIQQQVWQLSVGFRFLDLGK